MTPDDFHYELPEELIAQEALPERSGSRLLRLFPDGALDDLRFADLPALLRAGDLLVVNDTRVIAARLAGRKRSGGRIEMLLERLLAADEARVQLRASHPPRAGTWLEFDGGATALVVERQGAFYRLRFTEPVAALLGRAGHVPLPPYIRRADVPADRERYQTVFAREPGAVAAPTAGLHFEPTLLAQLGAAGIGLAHITLHVGAGTFAPLREEQLASGRLHPEQVAVAAPTVERIQQVRAAGGRIVAVGTTVVRALETAATEESGLAPFAGDTDLFIRPGYRFRVVDALVTNFHLPRSSLLMLVCAFGGTERMLAAYRHAVAARYRFFSYGDAMFVERAGT